MKATENTVANTVASIYLRDRVIAAHRQSDGVPSVDVSLMDKTGRKRVERMCKARDTFISGSSLDAASRQAGVNARRFQRIMTRYLEVADDGRIGGERVFQSHWRPHRHPKRVKPLDASKAGVWGATTGLFRQLMAENEDLRKDLVAALRRKGKAVLQVNKLVGRELRKLLERLCVAHEVAEDAYPLSTKDKGLRALRRWIVSDFLPLYASDWITAEAGSKPLQAGGEPVLKPTVVAEYEPYVAWTLDMARVDVRTAIEIVNASGDVDVVEVECFHVLRVIELGYATTLAYLIIYGRQVMAEDLGNLMWRALNGWTIREVLPDLRMDPSGGFPVMVMSELRWRKPKVIYLDNALAHLSAVFGVIVELTMGADVKPGNPASPLERAEIETKFAIAARRLFHQLPATKGTGPTDPQRKRGDKVQVEGLIRADEIEHAYAVMMGNENGAVATAAHGIPPLERLRRALIRGAITAAPVALSSRCRHMFFPSRRVLVHAKADDTRRPYVNYDRIRYSSTELQRRYDLNGKYLYARADEDDLRVIILFDDKGAEVCRAHGEGRWGLIPHDRRMRRMALRNIDKAQFENMPQDGPLLALFASLQRDAPSKPSAALQLAHCLAVLGRHFQGETIDTAWLGHLLATGSTLDAAAYMDQPSANSPAMAATPPTSGPAATPAQIAASAPVNVPPGALPSAEQLVPRNAVRRAA
jgi:hypothetical protein